MTNPYARLIDECGLTQADFLRRVGISKTTLTYVTTGQYRKISQRLNEELGKLCHEKGVDAQEIFLEEYESATLREAYQHWRHTERMKMRSKYAIDPPERWDRHTSPLESYIRDTAGSVQRFCKEVKVDAASVRRYLKGINARMPLDLQEALEDVGMKPHMNKLIAMQTNWIDEFA